MYCYVHPIMNKVFFLLRVPCLCRLWCPLNATHHSKSLKLERQCYGCSTFKALGFERGTGHRTPCEEIVGRSGSDSPTRIVRKQPSIDTQNSKPLQPS